MRRARRHHGIRRRHGTQRLRRQIGVVFQAQSIDVKLTADENLWHQGHLYGLRGAALKRDRGNAEPGWSGGSRQ